MRVELQVRKLWQTVNENIVPPTNEKALEAFNTKNELATFMIYRAVSDDVLLMIFSSTSAKEAWDKLKQIYLGTNFSRRFTILQNLLQSRQREDENMAIYLNKIIDLRTQLVACGCNWINDEFMVFIILQSFSPKFSNFVIIMETRLDDEKEIFSLETLTRHLLKHEETLNNKVLISPKDNNVALGATKTPFKKKSHHKKKSYPSFSTRFEKRGNGYRNNDNYSNNRNNNNSRNNGNNFKQRDGKGKPNNPYPKENFDGNCNYCGIQGHREVDCYKKKRDEKFKGNGNVRNFKGKKNIHAGLAMAYYSMSQTLSFEWIVNSGCTNHLCFEKKKFEDFHKYRKDTVVIGDNSTLEVQGIGSVIIHGKVLNDVLYVPKLWMNLLSVIQVARKGYSFEFDSQSWCIKKGLATLVKGFVKDNIYIVDQVPSKICLATSVCSKGNLWHHRLGHLNHKSIQGMKDLVEGLPSISPSVGLCEKCILGNMHRQKFEKDKAIRASQLLQLVHSNLMGPFQTKSLGGASYILTFIDDFSRMTFGYLLEHKD